MKREIGASVIRYTTAITVPVVSTIYMHNNE